MMNYYRTLGVDPQSEPAVIRSAYLALIRRYHPDKGGTEADAARTQAVTAAWDVLRDSRRRAAYDETRQARFQPAGGSIVGPAVLSTVSRVRGGAAGRNLFLLLAAGTVGLGWWALQQPQLTPPVRVAASANTPGTSPPATSVAPAVKDESEIIERSEELPPLPDKDREPEVELKAELSSLPEAEPARMPVRTAQTEAQPRRAPTVRVDAAPAAAPGQAERLVEAATAKPEDAPSRIDLAPLERHLQLLTDQSLRFGTDAKRNRLLASRESFLVRFRQCDSDICKRDAYLRRNAEIGEIMGQ